MVRNVKILSEEILSNNFFPLKKIKYEVEKQDGTKDQLSREVYQSANGAVVLLYNAEDEKVILTKQFRLTTYINGNESGMLVEACAGIVEKEEAPADAIIREIEEETGYRVQEVKQIFEMYMTPGSVAEKLYFFVAEYTQQQRVNEGGGLDEEKEDIEVLELPFQKAFDMIHSGEIKDGKTALLLQYAKLYLMKGDKVFDIL